MEDKFAFVLSLVALIGGFTVLQGLVRVWSARIHARSATHDPALAGQVESLTAELEQTRRDIADLQERLDFAERVLAKQQDPARVAPPK